MIQALLVTICLVVFPYQGSSIILESGNVNDYEVVYPQKVPALPKGGVQNAEPEDSQSACCSATTCKLQPGAQCESGECCEQCRFKEAGAECRAAKDDCDLAERCTGQSAECPLDQFQTDGEPCKNNQGYCYNGKCPTLESQCIDLLGPDATVSPDTCFQHNLGGTDYSFCRSGNENIPCAPADVKCGRLYCSRGSSRYTAVCNFRFSLNDPDYGIVHPGTKCGDGKVCSNGQCVDVQTAY